uniref:Reverse transcriptase domain-containing protein n=1 Tax=Amphimedon queenslandica TaxID=400682 RepID=A0A1X7T1Y9_AMPQE
LTGLFWAGNGKGRYLWTLPCHLACAQPQRFFLPWLIIEWCFWQAGVQYVDHYLDNYIVLVACGTTECALSLEIVMSVANDLGVPLVEDKCEGHTTSFVFLGFEIDSSEGLLWLPQEKVDRLQEMLLGWFEKRWCWRLDLGVAHWEAAGHR